MKIDVNEKGEIILSQVYNAIGIKTESGTYGIAERDGGLEIMLDGHQIVSLPLDTGSNHEHVGRARQDRRGVCPSCDSSDNHVRRQAAYAERICHQCGYTWPSVI